MQINKEITGKSVKIGKEMVALSALLESKLPEKGNTLNRPGHTARAGQLQFSSLKHQICYFSSFYFSLFCGLFLP